VSLLWLMSLLLLVPLLYWYLRYCWRSMLAFLAFLPAVADIHDGSAAAGVPRCC
jgi:hypothetical protein